MNSQAAYSGMREQEELEFAPGTILRAAGQVYRVLEGSRADALLIQDLNSKDVRRSNQSFLRLAIAQGAIMVASPDHRPAEVHLQYRVPGEYDEWIEQIPVSIRSEAAVLVMINKHKWIKMLQSHHMRNFRPSEELAMKIRELEKINGENCPYGMHTLYRVWLTLQKNHGQVKSLLPRFDRRGGAGGRRLEGEVELIVQKVLTLMGEKSSEKLQAARAYVAVVAHVKDANNHRVAREKLSIPSAPTIGRRFKDHFGAYEIACRNFGKARANLLFRQNGARIQAERALDIVQYDDTDTCVFAVDDQTGLPWGRCWATAGIDDATGSVTGISLSELPRSTVSAHEAVMHSLAPKDHTSTDFELCKGRWYAYGNQGLVVLDNASYNASHDFQASLADLNIEFEFARPHHPTNKTRIEYFNHRLKSEFCAQLPGWSGPKEDRELLNVGIGTAVLELSNLRKKLFRWIVDDYSNKPIQGGKSPRDQWQENFALHEPFLPQRMPSDELIGTIPSILTFRDSGGLLRKKLRYQSESLEVIRRRLGRRSEINVRFRPYVLDFLYVEDPTTKNYLKVPCIEDPRIYRGISDRQLTLIISKTRAMFGKNANLDQMMAAREALAAETKVLMRSRNMRDRKQAVRRNGLEVPNGEPSNQSPNLDFLKTKTVSVSALEDMVMRIEEDNPETEPDMQVIMYGEDILD